MDPPPLSIAAQSLHRVYTALAVLMVTAAQCMRQLHLVHRFANMTLRPDIKSFRFVGQLVHRVLRG